MQRLIQLVHIQQHPPKESCKNQRLLVIQFINSFEGLGSILKLITLGLAEAAHSNRTLIWGLHPLPHMFEKSRDEWFNKKATTGKRKVMVKGLEFDCAYDDDDIGYDGSGPYACFFHPLSSCTMNDVSYEEMIQMGSNGYSDVARVKIQEERRAPAAYQYPVHNRHYTKAFGTTGPPANLRHKWAGVLSAYVFRLKPNVVDLMEQRRLDLWPIHMGGNGFERNCYQFCPDQFEGVHRDSEGDPIWGLHVRHGDMKAYQDIYGNRKLYPFEDYLLAAQRRGHQAVIEGNYSALPAAIYISSDSLEIPEFIRDTCDSPGMWEWLVTEDVNHDLFYDPPCLFSAEDRFRTEHGSHTVSGAGACAHTYSQGPYTMTCALKVADFAMYKKFHDDVKNMSLARRLMRALFEALEDMYLLSLMDFFVGTLSSHYSTHVAMLVWARKGAINPAQEVAFLDRDYVESGFHENSYFLFIMRPLLKPWEGRNRWIHHTRRFLEGLTNYNVHTGLNSTVGEEPLYRIRMVDQLPWVPTEAFRRETLRWMGGAISPPAIAPPASVKHDDGDDGDEGDEGDEGDAGSADLPITGRGIWPGECPLDPALTRSIHTHLTAEKITLDDVMMDIATLLNFGADHHEIHHNQAIRCWRQAADLLRMLRAAVKSSDTVALNTIKDYEEVAAGNIHTLAASRMSPFSNGEYEIKKLLKDNFGRTVK